MAITALFILDAVALENEEPLRHKIVFMSTAKTMYEPAVVGTEHKAAELGTVHLVGPRCSAEPITVMYKDYHIRSRYSLDGPCYIFTVLDCF